MYRNILVPVDIDHPESWTDLISTVSSFADRLPAKRTVCTIVSEIGAIKQGEWLPISVEQLLFDARARLEGIVASAEDGLQWEVEVAAGTIANGVLGIAERIGADLIILASHKPAARDHFLAANAIRIARRAPCSVLIVRPGSA